MTIRQSIEARKTEIAAINADLKASGVTAMQAIDNLFANAGGRWLEGDDLYRLKNLSFIAHNNGEFSADKNKAEAMNIVHAALIEARDLYITELQAGYKLKADGSLFKKDKPRFDAVRDLISEKHGVRIFGHFSYARFMIDCNKWYNDSIKDRTGYVSGDSYSREIAIFNTDTNEPIFVELQTISASDIDAAKKRLIEIDTEISNLRSEANSLKAKFEVR